MSGLNKVMLIGRLGQEPTIKYSQQGTAVCTFSLATSEQWTDKSTGERQEKTEWHNCVTFNKQAETCEKYLSKGSQIYIEGRLQTSTYEKEDQTHYMTKIVVSNFQFLGGKQDSGQKQDRQQKQQYQAQSKPQQNMGGQPIPASRQREYNDPAEDD